MCENARRCERCNHKHRIIKLLTMNYEGEYRGVWLCEECEKALEKEKREREKVFKEIENEQ